MKINEAGPGDLELISISLRDILVPQLSESDKKMAQTFDNIEKSLNSEDNFLINALKYTFIIRYLSNNQVILYSSLLNADIPLNLHLTG